MNLILLQLTDFISKLEDDVTDIDGAGPAVVYMLHTYLPLGACFL